MKYEELDAATKAKLYDIKANFLSACGCEPYYSHTCSRCARLAKQSPEGDVLEGEVITGMMLHSLGLIDDPKYAASAAS